MRLKKALSVVVVVLFTAVVVVFNSINGITAVEGSILNKVERLEKAQSLEIYDMDVENLHAYDQEVKLTEALSVQSELKEAESEEYIESIKKELEKERRISEEKKIAKEIEEKKEAERKRKEEEKRRKEEEAKRKAELEKAKKKYKKTVVEKPKETGGSGGHLLSPSRLSASDIDRFLRGTDMAGLGQAFKNVERDTGVNAAFMTALGIHESGWGRSKIARDKKNLFGYGAYNSSPYQSAHTFDSYEDGIRKVAERIRRNYLEPSGKYYNGPTVEGVNVKYCLTDDGRTSYSWSRNINRLMRKMGEFK